MIIASQALISGAFTLVNEAMKLRLWPNMIVNYPTEEQGQIYIPSINWDLLEKEGTAYTKALGKKAIAAGDTGGY